MRLLPLLLLVGCGGGPQLSNLRCRAARCQDVEDPVKLLLAVDFRDDTGTLGKGVLELRLNGRTQTTVSAADVFAAQKLAPGAKAGTLQLDDDILLDRMTQGEQVQVSVVAVDGQGQGSNEPSLTFALHLGGP